MWYVGVQAEFFLQYLRFRPVGGVFSNFWMIRIFMIFPIPPKKISLKVGENLRYLEPEKNSLKITQ